MDSCCWGCGIDTASGSEIRMEPLRGNHSRRRKQSYIQLPDHFVNRRKKEARRRNLPSHRKDIDSDEDDIPEEIVKEIESFENRPKSNLDETEVVNLGDAENVKETRISVHLSPSEKEEYTEFLREYEDIFAWSYDDMTGLITSIVTHKLPTNPTCPPEAIKGQALADHLAENPMDGEYEPLKTYFPDEEVSFIGEDIVKSYDGWRMFFDGTANFKGVGIGAVLVSETGQHYPVSAKLRFSCTNNIAKYEDCILGLKMATDMSIQDLLVIGDSDLLIHQIREEWVTKNSKILSYLHYVQELRKRFTNMEFQYVPRVQNEFADALATLPSMIQHPDKNFIDHILVKVHDQQAYCAQVEEEADEKPWFHDIKEYLAKGEYPELANPTQKRTLQRLSNNFFHSGGILYRRTPDLGLLRCVDAKEASKLLEDIHAGTCDLHMNGFVLAKKILRAASYRAVIKKVVVDFVRDGIVCRFGIPESIITDNGSNLNSDLMKAMCDTFRIRHRNSIAYRPQMNGAVAANKNIKKILRKMIEKHKQWHEKLSFALLGYHTTVRISTRATPYMLVYGTEAVIPAEVEIPSLRII
ncbi:uncharacterized protein [Nicotiana sylvestris]|uniref:uncharacterized protein n=1 Tax=Nicotiana sylvestris TaxID=4096 RepID=UPI00388C7913